MSTHKESILSFKVLQVVVVAKLSPANNRHGILVALGRNLKPVPELGDLERLLNWKTNTSIHRIKRRGERGSPCWSPLVDLNHGPVLPLNLGSRRH